MAKRQAYNPLLKSYPDSEKINRVSEGAEVLYVRLLAASDDYHHYYADPARVAHKLFTDRMLAGQLTVKDVAARLDELRQVDLIQFYEADDKPYLEIVDCFKKFRPDVKRVGCFPMPPVSLIPPPIRDRPAHVPHPLRDCPTNGSSTQPNPTQLNSTQTQPKKTPKPPKNPLDKITYPDGMDTPEVRETIERWLAYRRKIQKPYKDMPQQIGLLLKKYADPASFAAAVENSIAQGFQGCYPPGREQYGKPKPTSQLGGRI